VSIDVADVLDKGPKRTTDIGKRNSWGGHFRVTFPFLRADMKRSIARPPQFPNRQRPAGSRGCALFFGGAGALPLNPTVVNGAASFSQAGSTLTVTNSNGAIINWQRFRIAAGETARFVQPSSTSSVLNQVLSNNPSALYGTLSSNGKVWLVNPCGHPGGCGA
jgi:filamentous hemagglutinin family protein